MTESVIEREYFEWMLNIVGEDDYLDDNSYRKLLTYLHGVEFKYRIRRDMGRAKDGIDLRRRFARDYERVGIEEIETYLSGPCSVLEMMIALAFRCEEIMDNPVLGDRTRQWFWKMIINLGLGPMTDGNFDIDVVKDTVDVFLRRNYEPDGRGGLFTVRRTTRDLRRVEIWTQMMWYLDTII